MKFKRYLVLLLMIAAMFFLFTACGDKDESSDDNSDSTSVHNKDGLFSLGYNPDYGLNPYSLTDTNNLMVASLMYDTIFEVDNSFRVSSRIIESYTTDDGLWWVFNVNTGIPFHDGSKLTVQDVVYSLQKASSSTMYSSRLSSIYGISALDDKSFAVSLTSANMQLPLLMTVPVIKDGSIGDDIPSGTGPYKLSSKTDSLVVFKDYYASDSLPIETIYLKAYQDRSDMISKFEASTIDIMFNEPLSTSPIACKGSFSSFYYNMTNLHFIGLNANSSFFYSDQYRNAMNYAIDRELLVASTFDSCAVATALPIHPASEYYNKELSNSLTYNMSSAKSILQNLSAQSEQTPVNFIVCNANSQKIYAARQITQNLNNLGLHVVLTELSWNDYIQALEDGNYDMYYGEIKLTPDFNLTSLLGSNGSSNYFHRDPSSYDSYIANYLSASDEDRALQADLMCKYISDDAVLIPICFTLGEVMTSSGMISNSSPTQYDAFHSIENWSITLK